jgi:hypothetical protein
VGASAFAGARARQRAASVEREVALERATSPDSEAAAQPFGDNAAPSCESDGDSALPCAATEETHYVGKDGPHTKQEVFLHFRRLDEWHTKQACQDGDWETDHSSSNGGASRDKDGDPEPQRRDDKALQQQLRSARVYLDYGAPSKFPALNQADQRGKPCMAFRRHNFFACT